MLKRNLKFFLLSLLLHITVLLLLITTYPLGKRRLSLSAPQKNKPSMGALDNKIEQVEIIEKSLKSHNKPIHGYYGIGIYVKPRSLVEVSCSGKLYKAYVVDTIIPGYGAADAGLISNDCIIAVNGISVSLGDNIIGNKPKILDLLICRDGNLMNVSAKRDWVNTN